MIAWRHREPDLRSTLYEHGLDVLLIQNVDEYQSGHIREHFQRIRWLCGFTGSYAQVIICKEGKCKFFTDSRYTIQASLEVDSAYFDLYNISDTPVASWMETNLPKGSTIGYYGELFTLYQASRLKSFNLKMLLQRFRNSAIILVQNKLVLFHHELKILQETHSQ